MNKTYVDLLMQNGELVRITCPSENEDELYETIENTMKRRDWWSPSQFEKCRAEYMGHCVSRVNMGQVVAML